MTPTKALKTTTVSLVVVALMFFYARSDYIWADRIKNAAPSDWSLVVQQDNFSALSKPWTLFKTPVTGLWFVKSGEIRQVAPHILLAPVLRFHYDYSQTEQYESYQLFDLQERKTAYLNDETEIDNLDIKKLEWHSYEVGTPGALLIQYFVLMFPNY